MTKRSEAASNLAQLRKVMFTKIAPVRPSYKYTPLKHRVHHRDSKINVVFRKIEYFTKIRRTLQMF